MQITCGYQRHCGFHIIPQLNGYRYCRYGYGVKFLTHGRPVPNPTYNTHFDLSEQSSSMSLHSLLLVVFCAWLFRHPSTDLLCTYHQRLTVKSNKIWHHTGITKFLQVAYDHLSLSDNTTSASLCKTQTHTPLPSMIFGTSSTPWNVCGLYYRTWSMALMKTIRRKSMGSSNDQSPAPTDSCLPLISPPHIRWASDWWAQPPSQWQSYTSVSHTTTFPHTQANPNTCTYPLTCVRWKKHTMTSHSNPSPTLTASHPTPSAKPPHTTFPVSEWDTNSTDCPANWPMSTISITPLTLIPSTTAPLPTHCYLNSSSISP